MSENNWCTLSLSVVQAVFSVCRLNSMSVVLTPGAADCINAWPTRLVSSHVFLNGSTFSFWNSCAITQFHQPSVTDRYTQLDTIFQCNLMALEGHTIWHITETYIIPYKVNLKNMIILWSKISTALITQLITHDVYGSVNIVKPCTNSPTSFNKYITMPVLIVVSWES